MQLFLSVEGQNCTEIGLSNVLVEMQNKLSCISCSDSEWIDRYGSEFLSIAIIPTCVDDDMWHALEWKERILLRRKNREADIRLRINYEEFKSAREEKKREIFVDTIIKSVRAIQSRSKGDFNAEALVADIIEATQ